jgi:hypothetical protein
MVNRPVTSAPAQLPGGATRERRASVRHVCEREGLSRPVELVDSISWGARVQDVSAGGLGLRLCYPFKPGAALAVDLRDDAGRTRTFLVRVVHAADQADGTWFLGCEFANALSEEEMAQLF